ANCCHKAMDATPPACSTSNTMDDIEYLLHLEAIKRHGDERKEIQRQVEEQMRIYQDAKRDYGREYARLAQFQKKVLLGKALQEPQTQIDDSHADDTSAKLNKSSSIIARTNRPTALDERVLEQCKRQLQQQHGQRRLQLAQHQQNFAENCETLNQVCSKLDIVETKFETATLVAMDQ
ncbi:hypothetical protein KR044_009627, partial [Drosophila immigrans]